MDPHRSLRSGLALLFLLGLVLAAPAVGADRMPTLGELVKRALAGGLCFAQGEMSVCHLEAVLKAGYVNMGSERPAMPYETVSLSVVTTTTDERIVVEEVFGQWERWRQEGDETVVEQLLLSYFGPHQGQGMARRLRLDGEDVLGSDRLPRTEEDAQSMWRLLETTFLAVQL
jgi:hypothetical protein